MQSLVQAESITHAHQTNARSAAEVGKHLPHELMQFGVVYHCSISLKKEREDGCATPLSLHRMSRPFRLGTVFDLFAASADTLRVEPVAPRLLHRTDARIRHMAEIGPPSRPALG
jgi:hypothetical protein